MLSNARNSSIFLLILAVTLTVFSCYSPREYPRFEEGSVVLKGDPGTWDENEVHDLSVVVANRSDYKYWGYYGLAYYDNSAEKGKAGLACSNDLVHWQKYPGNPVIKANCRWPSVILVNDIFHLFYAQYDSNVDSRIVRVTSKDGINFFQEEIVVPREPGLQNQNPFIWYNSQNAKYYLYYYHGDERSAVNKHWDINVKIAADIESLAGTSPQRLVTSANTLAAPSMAYFNGRYFLTAEALDGTTWITKAFISLAPDGPFEEVSNNPVLANDDACAFQHIFNDTLYLYYSHRYSRAEEEIDSTNCWDLRMVKTAVNQ
jgi:hypothetical protein